MIKKIKLHNFRCHDSYELEFKPDTTLILGPNGCGKTSVLEAIYLLMQGKSFRADDDEILKRDRNNYRAELEYGDGQTTAVSFGNYQRTFMYGDSKTKTLPRTKKHPVVLFEPKDLNLIATGNTERRKYLDSFFSQLSEDYAEALSRYQRALTQRNKLLKDENVTRDTVFPWSIMLARNGLFLSRNRKALVEKINSRLTHFYRAIAENNDVVNIVYDSEVRLNTGDDEAAYLKDIEQNFEKERVVGHTLFGAQKDKFGFTFNGVEASGSASRGESRSIILALKFIEAKLLAGILHEQPVILLDDVFSELDESRRQALINNFKDHQVIITSVEKVTD